MAGGLQGNQALHPPYPTRVGDDVPITIGSVVELVWDTTDPNANAFYVELPAGTAVDVPVIVFGIGHVGVNLALFDGITQPTVAVLDADRDSFIALDFQGDDVARLRANVPILISTSTGDLTLDPTGNIVVGTTRLQEKQGTDTAAANNLVLPGDGNTVEITDATEIQLIANTSWQNGSLVTLLFTSNPTVKHATATSGANITILLAGAADFSATAGDTLTLRLSEIGGTQAWREVARAAI